MMKTTASTREKYWERPFIKLTVFLIGLVLIFVFIVEPRLGEEVYDPQCGTHLPTYLIPTIDKVLLKKLAQRKYFPPGVFASISPVNDMMQDWCSLHLIAMEEDPFWKANIKDLRASASNKYRLLYLPTNQRPIMIRIEILLDGRGILIVKETSERGGFRIGKLQFNKVIKLNRDQTKEFMEQIDKSDFWNMNSYDESITVMDGTMWFIEGVQGKKYHIVNRYAGQKGEFENIGLLSFKMAGIEKEKGLAWGDMGHSLAERSSSAAKMILQPH